MKLILTDDIPVHRPPRRLAPAERVTVAKQIDEWLQEGIIQHSRSQYASPVVVVAKKDGTKRLCVDYRGLNMKVIKDRYPLPIIEDILEGMAGASVFTTLDLKNVFFHVDVEIESMKYTAFVTPDEHFEFRKVPFGLCNSPAIFQRYINMIFAPLMLEKVVVIYMDDLIIATTNERDNITNVARVLSVAEQHGLCVKFSKCQFVKKRVTFLGHILEDGTIKPSTEKSLAIRHYPEPKTLKQIQSFLGLAEYFRKCVSNFSLVAKPLTTLTKKNAVFEFGDAQRQAFEQLKQALCSESVLKVFDPLRQTELHTDASKLGYGACLLQEYDKVWHPVFWLSEKTKPAEEKYCSERINGIIIPALTKMSIDDPTKYQHVNKLQRFMNSTITRSTTKPPFELMFGVTMRNPEDVPLATALEK